MDIKLEPKSDGMMRVWFSFCEEQPDPEDLWVRPILEDFHVPPKRRGEDTRDGRTYAVMQWGQCVIAEALYAVELHQKLVREVQRLCAAELETAGLEGAARAATISEVALEFQPAAHIKTIVEADNTEHHELMVDRDALQARMLERLATVA